MAIKKIIFWLIFTSFCTLFPTVPNVAAQDDSYSDGGYSASYYSDNSSVSLGSDQAYSADQLGGCCSHGGNYGDTPYGDNGVGYGDSGSGYSDSGSSGSGYTDNGNGYQDSGGGSGCVSAGYFNNYGRVYVDNNRNGSFDTGDSALANQTIQLVHLSSGAIWATAQTNASGNYTIISEANQQLGIRYANIPANAVRINPTYDMYIVIGNCPRSYSFGVAYNAAPATPPGPFGHSSQSANCLSSNQPQVTVNWTASSNATSYRIYYLDSSVGTAQPPQGINVGNVTSYSLTQANGLIQGHYYGFSIVAVNSQGEVVSNQSPYSPTSPGGWSHPLFGWTLVPSCGAPGAFNFLNAPVAGCPAFGQSQIQVHWTLASNASYYKIYPQSTLRGWPVSWPNGYDPSGIFTTYSPPQAFFAHNIPAPVPFYEHWEYTVYALNAFGYSQANGSSSYYVYGWTRANNCEIPVVDLRIDGSDLVKTVNNGASVNLSYSAQNTYLLNTTSNYSIPPTAPWTSLYPTSSLASNSSYEGGNRTVTLYNNSTYPYSTYQFTITGINDKIGSYAVSRTVTVNVLPDLAPFIQTTQGDVHSNEDINVAQ
jgi:hypothetical protein